MAQNIKAVVSVRLTELSTTTDIPKEEWKDNVCLSNGLGHSALDFLFLDILLLQMKVCLSNLPFFFTCVSRFAYNDFF